MQNVVVVDSDAIFALYNPNDALHTQATRTFHQLVTQGYTLLYPTAVLFEVVSLFQRVLPTPTVTKKLIELIKNGQLFIHGVDTDILKEAATVFEPAGNKTHTLIDCSVVVIARKTHARGVFAYDNFYTKHGLQRAEDLL